MSIRFGFHMDFPKEVLSERAARGHILRTLQIVGKKMTDDLNKTTKTWVEHKVDFNPIVRYAGGDARVLAEAEGDEESLRIWHYLDGGTQLRWARLSFNWYSKTAPGTFESQTGAGSVLLRGKTAMTWAGFDENWARDHAIEKRGWTDTINDTYEQILYDELMVVIDFITGNW